VCHVDNLNLNQGNYVVTVEITENARAVDRIEAACYFTVVPDDVYGTGNITTAQQGVMVLPHSWTYQEARAATLAEEA